MTIKSPGTVILLGPHPNSSFLSFTCTALSHMTSYPSKNLFFLTSLRSLTLFCNSFKWSFHMSIEVSKRIIYKNITMFYSWNYYIINQPKFKEKKKISTTTGFILHLICTINITNILPKVYSFDSVDLNNSVLELIKCSNINSCVNIHYIQTYWTTTLFMALY